MEQKIDRFVELVVTGQFYFVTSVFDSATSSTTNVPKDQLEDGLKNEVGVDHVMVELANETKLEEEAGEEIGEGKET